jgi:molybdenum cofactor cytidylyltransferase
VIPLGIVTAGGRVRRFGMPVDPGNLLLLGDVASRTVIGVPSCASSPKINGLDWVLERTLAGIEVTGEDISAMAVGGLLMEIQSRPQPREKDDSQVIRRAPRIAAVVLAAGRSMRMGKRNKLLEVVAGRSMIQHAVTAAEQSRVATITVVTGHEADRVTKELAGHDVAFVHNPNYADGLATSLVVGLNALPDDCDGAIVLLGDMPGVSAQVIDRLLAAFAPEDGRGICVPTSDGRRGNPILWARRYFADMKNLKGDVGAKSLLGVHSEDIAEVPIDTGDVLTDIDTPEALELARTSPQG